MKKTIFFSILILVLGCKKDPFEESLNGLKEENLPIEFMGDWRWQYSSGGFTGAQRILDSTAKSILTIEINKTYKWCKNDISTTGKWFYGSSPIANQKDTAFTLVFESPKVRTNFPMLSNQHKPIRIVDTLVLSDRCDDCFSHKFVRVK